jgi:hypothetical protein
MARTSERRLPLTVMVSPLMKAELEAEAWEEQRTLSDYIRGLLTRRGKWARSVGHAGGYDIGPAKVKVKRARKS